ncbi:MAG: hypothetical protein WAZ99_06765, partial [Rectinemataceae bacterium]
MPMMKRLDPDDSNASFTPSGATAVCSLTRQLKNYWSVWNGPLRLGPFQTKRFLFNCRVSNSESPMFQGFITGFREGLEAFLVLAVMVRYL